VFSFPFQFLHIYHLHKNNDVTMIWQNFQAQFPWLFHIWIREMIDWTVGLRGHIGMLFTLAGGTGCIMSIESTSDGPLPKSFLVVKALWWGLETPWVRKLPCLMPDYFPPYQHFSKLINYFFFTLLVLCLAWSMQENACNPVFSCYLWAVCI